MTKMLFMFVSLLLFAGCGPKKIAVDPMDEGFAKMERSDFGGAILFFENLRMRDGRPEVRIALASAYAGRAGVQIVDYWKFIEKFRADRITSARIRRDESYEGNVKKIEPAADLLTDPLRGHLDSIFFLVSALRIYKDRVRDLPYVEIQKRPDLRQAIDLLQGIPNSGGRIYRALLVSADLRSGLDDGFNVWGVIQDHIADVLHSPEEALKTFCTPVTGNFTEWLREIFREVSTSTDDLAVAFPSNADAYRPFENDAVALSDRLPEFQKSLVLNGCQ